MGMKLSGNTKHHKEIRELSFLTSDFCHRCGGTESEKINVALYRTTSKGTLGVSQKTSDCVIVCDSAHPNLAKYPLCFVCELMVPCEWGIKPIKSLFASQKESSLCQSRDSLRAQRGGEVFFLSSPDRDRVDSAVMVDRHRPEWYFMETQTGLYNQPSTQLR